MATYKLGKYSFNSQSEYDKAKQEWEFIKRANEKYDLNNPQIAQKILDKYTPQTIIGREFCEKLRSNCQRRNVSTNPRQNEVVDSSNMVYYDPNKIEIVNRLKKYNSTFECTCLECGYKGPMGVVSKGNKSRQILAFFIAAAIFLLFVPKLFYAFGVTLSGILLFWLISSIVQNKLKANQMTLYCPNCEKIIYTK